MLKTCLLTLLMLLSLGAAQSRAEDDATLLTFWPLLDYRADRNIDYRSFHLLGPLVKYERKGDETEQALRPLFYRAADETGRSQLEVFYPVFSKKTDPGSTRLNLLQLLYSDYSTGENGGMQEFYLFPLLFYSPDRGRDDGSFAFFPFGGTLKNRFDRDEINFTLFPLYSRTHKGERRVDNLLWPFFARISGEEESGYKVWPFFGKSRKEGVYRKTFFLWPIFFSEDLALDTDNPVRKRAALPFYLSIESPESSYHTWLWPFFSRRLDHAREYVEWNAPWPLVRVTRGETRHGVRVLPFYADETVETHRKRWYVWPLYKIEDIRLEDYRRRRHRVLFFLFSNLYEEQADWQSEKRRVDLWPLFSYSRQRGISHLHVFSLLEPFFPGNDAIERSWAPLWRFYQQKWDGDGNRVVSLLWNLYWLEKRGKALAWELFPLVDYRRDQAAQTDVRLLKGLFHYHANPDGRSLKLFFLPWGLSWGMDRADSGRMET